MDTYQAYIKRLHDKVTQSTRHLKAFIYDSAYTFRYTYEDRLILHEKAPGEIAFGTMNQFNLFLGRHIEKGARRIYLSQKPGEKSSFVFKFSDTIKVDHEKPDLDLFSYDLTDRACFDVLCESYGISHGQGAGDEPFFLEDIARKISEKLDLSKEQMSDFIDTFILMLSRRMNYTLPRDFFDIDLEQIRKYPYVKLKALLDLTAQEVDTFIVTLENLRLEMKGNISDERNQNRWENMDRGEWILFAQNCTTLRRSYLLYKKGWLSHTYSEKDLRAWQQSYRDAVGYLARFYSHQRGGIIYESERGNLSIVREFAKTFGIHEPRDIKGLIEKSRGGTPSLRDGLDRKKNPVSSLLREGGTPKDLSTDVLERQARGLTPNSGAYQSVDNSEKQPKERMGENPTKREDEPTIASNTFSKLPRGNDSNTDHLQVENDGQLSFSFLLPFDLEEDEGKDLGESHVDKEAFEEKIIEQIESTHQDYFTAYHEVVVDQSKELIEESQMSTKDFSKEVMDELVDAIGDLKLSKEALFTLIDPDLSLAKIKSLRASLEAYIQDPNEEMLEKIKFMAQFDKTSFSLRKIEYWELYKEAILGDVIRMEQLESIEDNLRGLNLQEHQEAIREMARENEHMIFALKVGYEFSLVPVYEIYQDIAIKEAGSYVQVDGKTYPVYIGETFEDSRKIEKYYLDHPDYKALSYSTYHVSEKMDQLKDNTSLEQTTKEDMKGTEDYASLLHQSFDVINDNGSLIANQFIVKVDHENQKFTVYCENNRGGDKYKVYTLPFDRLHSIGKIDGDGNNLKLTKHRPETIEKKLESYHDWQRRNQPVASLDYWVIEFNETIEGIIKSYRGERVTLELLETIKKEDARIKTINDTVGKNTYGQITDEYLGYYKFYFDHVGGGKVIQHERIDIGDGNEVNEPYFALIRQSIQNQMLLSSLGEYKFNQIKKAILEFVHREYETAINIEDFEKEYPDVSHIGLAFSETEDGKHSIQVNLNLMDFAYETYVDDTFIQRESLLEDMSEEKAFDYLLEDLKRGDFTSFLKVDEEHLLKVLGLRIDEDGNFYPKDRKLQIPSVEDLGLSNLAKDLDELIYDLDPYEYQDRVGLTQEDRVKHMESIHQDLLIGNFKNYLGYLETILEEELPEDIQVEALKIEVERAKESIAKETKTNFVISQETLPEKLTKSERLNQNLEAILMLKRLEQGDRYLEETAQEILARYVGWGGLAEVFDETKGGMYQEARDFLKQHLSILEYTQAKESTLTAFYTPKVVIDTMYQALQKMGFVPGKILEPSLGVGHFIGNVPTDLKESQFYGFEIDQLSGKIASWLYPEAKIDITGYERSHYQDEFFDLSIGNIPFGNFKINDRRYNHHEFLIHDYFFAKTIDQVRKGGLIAFITSSGTLDKQNKEVRKYIGKRCELVGAIRLPNNAFWDVAGTKVTSDIIFLKKREQEIEMDEPWYHLGTDERGLTYNQYFIDHPEMVMGTLELANNGYGREMVVCRADEIPLEEKLKQAVQSFSPIYEVREKNLEESPKVHEEIRIEVSEDKYLKYSFVEVDGKIYYKEVEELTEREFKPKEEQIVKAYIHLRNCLREVIKTQLEEVDEEKIVGARLDLERAYSNFFIRYERLGARTNTRLLREDASFPLVSTLEIYEEGEFVRKSDIFTKRTIYKSEPITKADNPESALILSVATKGRVDLEYMLSLLPGTSREEMIKELKGQLFANYSLYQGYKKEKTYVTADEYLSGNIRDKINTLEDLSYQHEQLLKKHDLVESEKEKLRWEQETIAFQKEKLLEVLPERIKASDISVILGSTWIPKEDIKQFVLELLQPAEWLHSRIEVKFTSFNGAWGIEGKKLDNYNDLARMTYGTHRVNAYKLIEDALNFRDTKVWDSEQNELGESIQVLNKKETMLANQKKDSIKEAFRDWIFRDMERRERLEELYNVKFNSIVNRHYDGSHLIFNGMSPEITLRKHQRDAIARCLYGGNALLAHVVGAGKTFEMIATAMESKNLGLSSKALFVVPNHLTEQWGKDFYRLYPGANVLVATKKDFEPKKRQKLISRIATGEYDAIILGHSQFEKIPMSKAYQVAHIQEELDEILAFIDAYKRDREMSFTIKEMQRTKKQLERRLEKLNDDFRKDDIICFEELGVDRLFIDEAHYYKNLFLYTKMRNVAGLSSAEAMKSSDLYMKCRYLDEMTGGKGIVFATGTPLSNSMTELYTMQRYLQYDELKDKGLHHFDSWASTFGETTTSVEIAPEGNTYRLKTRFSKFYNLPELMSLFKEIADIKTADMINLDVPIAHYENIVTKPTQEQKELLQGFLERAEKIRDKQVDVSEDNFLKLTTDGKKLAIDQRLLDPSLPDDPGSKVNACVENIFRIWEEHQETRKTQLVFSDSSTPKGDGSFNIYDDMKQKLMDRGVPEEEIAFIHDANSDAQKDQLFAKVRKGSVRILFGSTAKMGAGTNVQDKLIAIHDVDVPWRPADVEHTQVVNYKNVTNRLSQ